jgi:hypothetical protein
MISKVMKEKEKRKCVYTKRRNLTDPNVIKKKAERKRTTGRK